MICLSREELHELSGYKRPSLVARWLRNQRIQFYEGADGWPRVLRTLVSPTASHTLTKSVPNVAALKELQSANNRKHI